MFSTTDRTAGKSYPPVSVGKPSLMRTCSRPQRWGGKTRRRQSALIRLVHLYASSALFGIASCQRIRRHLSSACFLTSFVYHSHCIDSRARRNTCRRTHRHSEPRRRKRRRDAKPTSASSASLDFSDSDLFQQKNVPPTRSAFCVLRVTARVSFAASRAQEQALNAQQNSWQSFNSKASAKSKSGFKRGKARQVRDCKLVAESCVRWWVQCLRLGPDRCAHSWLGVQSIFATPDTLDGKVGVVGSGKGITEFEQRKKHKFAGGAV